MTAGAQGLGGWWAGLATVVKVLVVAAVAVLFIGGWKLYAYDRAHTYSPGEHIFLTAMRADGASPETSDYEIVTAGRAECDALKGGDDVPLLYGLRPDFPGVSTKLEVDDAINDICPQYLGGIPNG